MKRAKTPSKHNHNDLANLLSCIVDTIPMYLFVKDTGDDFRYIYSSPMMNSLFFRNDDVATGKTDFDFISDQAAAQAFRDKDQEVLSTGNKDRYIEKVVDPYGNIRLIDTIKTLVPQEGKAPYLLGLARDVTQQKQIGDELQRYSKRLAMACQAGSIHPWVWDMINNVAEVSLVDNGVIKQRFITHEEFKEAIHPDDYEMYCRVTEEFTSGTSPSCRFCFRCRLFSGSDYIWYEKVGEVYEYDEQGRPHWSIGILRDITADRRHEADIRARELAEVSNQMKSAFIANMSHEIRTPLNAIVGFSALLAQTEDPEEKQEYLKVIETSNEFLLQLIGDILDISKIESGKLEFVYTPFTLRELFAAQQQAFSLRVDKEVKVVFESGDTDYRIESEKTRFTQVLANFLSNASKFTTSGSIRFGYMTTESGLYVYVTDTGIGIPKDKLDRVFERFVKLDNFKQGTGLGLSICKTIINMLHGEVGVTSNEGQGATFWFAIPCQPVKLD